MDNRPIDIDALLENAENDPVLTDKLLQIDPFIERLKKETDLKDDEDFVIDGTLTDYFLGTLSHDAAISEIKEQLEAGGAVKTIDDIVNKVTVFIDSFATSVAPAPLELPVAEAPNPSEALASVQARLKEETVTPPVIRNASFDIKPIVPIAPPASRLDPYKEPLE